MPLENEPNSPMRPQPPSIDDPERSGGVTKPMRPQPPAVRDPRQAESPASTDQSRYRIGDESESGSQETLEDQQEDEPYRREGQPDWEKRAKDAYRFSTTYIDSNLRQQWDDSLRAFNNQHPGDSKYNGENFRKRSHLFVPITRTVIRKNEAAACQAFFSNQDLISVQAMNQSDPKQLLSAELNKQLLQYRLTHTIPWFRTLIGGLQDAQAQGACVARVKWCYETKIDAKGRTRMAKDEPQVILFPLENLRIDPSAHWADPINSSAYLIELIPMFMGDVLEKMTKEDPKGRKWHEYDVADIKSDNPDDSTRSARIGNQQDPTQEHRGVSDYEIVWIQRHIHRWDGSDWEFYTLNNGKLLTEPDLLENTVFHGERDYVLGIAMIETHKPLPTSVPTLVKPLQEGINAIENQRNDNVLLVLNKRWKVKRGTNVDTASLMRNVPGGVAQVDNMEDLEEINWQDVTASSYQEAAQKRQAFDDLIGNFNPMQMHQAGAPREAQGTIKMLQGPASLMTEYLLTTYAMTFVIPVLRQLVLLEQHYETDKTILAIAGQKAKQYQKFDEDEITDDMLDHEVTTTVNVGMGATDPMAKIARFVYAVQSFAQVAAKPPAGVNLAEVWKELMALSGYQDGARFSTKDNPEMAKLEQINKALSMQIQDLKRHKADKETGNVVKLITSREGNQTKLKVAQVAHAGKRGLLYESHLLDQDDMLLNKALGATQLPGEQPPGAPAGAPGAAPAAA